LPSAERQEILVISRDEEKRPLARVVDLKAALREGNISKDIVLSQYDVVYVPKSSIARRGEWVDQYVNAILPDVFRLNYSLGGSLMDHEPLIR